MIWVIKPLMSSLIELKNFVKRQFPKAKIVIASKSEPYRHNRKRDEIVVTKGADGLVAALDPVMQAVDGIWVAAGLADADFEDTDEAGRIRVPVDTKKYTLKRLAFSEVEKEAMNNTAPGGFWPLCHICFVEPIFDKKDWDEYKKINKRVADAILEELDGKEGVVWLHDYHLVMCAKYLKEKNPNLTVGLFWHIPWPDWETFVRHPWSEDIIEGMLANDLLGFHTKYYCNNFIRCCQRVTEATVDNDYMTIIKGTNRTKVMAFPISIDFRKFDNLSQRLDKKYLSKVREKYRLKDRIVAMSAERFVYTKGIKQKIKAVDRLLSRNPDLIGKFVFLDITALAGSHSLLEAGKRYHDECIKLMYAVNEKYETSEWQPIVLTEYFVKPRELCAIYSMSDICFITPLHDGMNLVAKEYLASKPNLDGALILSEFAGAAVELKESILVNPFSVEELTDSIEQALSMPDAEKHWRMNVLRSRVKANNVYDWAKEFFMELSVLHSERKAIE